MRSRKIVSSKAVVQPQRAKKWKHESGLLRLERRVTRSSRPQIPYDIVRDHILPMRTHIEIKRLVLRAIISKNIGDLFTLVGRQKATVPSYLSSNDLYATAAITARAFIVLPVLFDLGFKFSSLVCTMKWLRNHECPWDDHTFHFSVSCNVRLDILEWLQQNHCPGMNSYLFYAAAKSGNVSTMKWLKEQECPWNETAFMAAAEHGNLKNMKWLKKNGCPWCVATSAAAAMNGSIVNIKWLKANGCPWNDDIEQWVTERLQQQH